MVRAIFIMLVVSICQNQALANQTVKFEDVWKAISSSALAPKAETENLAAARVNLERASRHWLPTLYLDARTVQTNDPGASFISLLEQRSLTNADFSADLINHPEARTFTRGALGLDLPLYEGGIKSSLKASSQAQMVLLENKKNQIQLQTYVEAATLYGNLGILQEQKLVLQQLDAQLEKIAKAYALGSKANPVGYSGLLGIQALQNRLKVTVVANATALQVIIDKLSQLGFLWKPEWQVDYSSLPTFLQSFLFSNQTTGKSSFALQMAKAQTQMAEQMVEVERGKTRPRLGLFGETTSFRGNRDTATGYSAGVYLQWNLFSPGDYAGSTEAQLRASAAQYNEAEAERREKMARAELLDKISLLRESCQLLGENNRLLAEQFRVSETLFRNGSINVLQFVEMINRRVDVTEAKTNAEQNYLSAQGQYALTNPFEIPTQEK